MTNLQLVGSFALLMFFINICLWVVILKLDSKIENRNTKMNLLIHDVENIKEKIK